MPTSGSHRRPYNPAALVLTLGCLALVGACDEELATGDDLRGLVVLSGDVGRTRLTVHATDDGSAGEVEVPDAATAWISGGPDGELVATLADGRLAVRGVLGDEAGDWRLVGRRDASAGTLLFGAASPDGKRAAALTLGTAGQFGVAIADLASGETATFPIDGAPLLTSPAWIDDERVGILAIDEPSGGAVSVADVSSGDVTGGPGNVRAVATSADGSAVAWIDATNGRLLASNLRTWLVGEAAGALEVEGPTGSRPGSFALDGTGRRLAVVWERDDGTVATIEVRLRTSDGWTVAGHLDVPGGDPRAVVSWLR